MNKKIVNQAENRVEEIKKKRKPKAEFRFNYDNKHKQFVFEQEGNQYRSVGLTHEEKTFGIKNMPLHANPQSKKNEQAYIRNGIVSGNVKSYSKRTIKSLKFSSEDLKNVKAKIRNYKKRRKKGK